MAPKKNSTGAGVSKAGISTSSTGERVIASSTRADGSIRKEIRVRPGYRPPEDVELYKNRTAEAYNNTGKGGVPGAETVPDDKGDKNAASSKNAKRREARKKAAAVAADKVDDTVEDRANGNSVERGTALEGTVTDAPAAMKDPEADKEKEAKKLAKKLRQARELKDKKDKGDALLPEQFEKVIRINELIRQLESLGFGPDGEKKETSGEAG